MVTLKQLKYFDAVVRKKHFGHAAEHCAVTQPALSMQIQDLEQSLGLSLLERTRKKVRLTEAGQQVARRARRILADVRDLESCAAQFGQLLCGSLPLGVIPSVAPYILPVVFPNLKSEYPLLDLQIRESQTEQLLQELDTGNLELLLLSLPIHYPGIETIELFKERFFLALPAHHPMANADFVSLDMLQGEHLLLLEEGHCLRDQALSFCHLNRSGHDLFGASSVSTLVRLVANGMGVTLLPEMSVPVENRNNEISLIPFYPPEPCRAIGLAWRASSPRKRDFIAFGQFIEKIVKNSFHINF